MIGRILIAVMAFAFGAALPLGALTGEAEAPAVKRDEELIVMTVGDDDGGDDTNTNSGFTSGVDSNDKTNSKHTAVTKDKDRSSGDLTRDKTKDGPGGKKRDWTKNKTNDNTKRDTR